MRVLNGFRTGETGRSDDEPVNLTVILSFLCVCVLLTYPHCAAGRRWTRGTARKDRLYIFLAVCVFIHVSHPLVCQTKRKRKKEKEKCGDVWGLC